ncbi:MAG TPA: PQQ-dependent sugar dehydrogenase [Candidatus Andersenbacteria bacterium]|nr:PQQ-dependent sugar dehydrogenase [Candidatus Andersenbacteria bacterium]
MKRIVVIFVLLVIIIVTFGIWQKDAIAPIVFIPIPEKDQEVIAENLNIPWEMVFLPDGSILLTERPGNLVYINKTKQKIPIAGVEHKGESGLLGLALHPDFTTNHFIYLYLTTKTDGELKNRVERYTFASNTVTNKQIVLDSIPGSSFHDGGRIAFGPDKKLYITTGDAGKSDNAQDVQSLAGKILRVNDDGSVPSDNPFGNAVYSYGHRNPQGLAWDTAGTLWATEHGRSVPKSGFDELNLIQAGRNYGWPIIQGNEVQSDMEPPLAHSGEEDTWAPSGAVVMGNTLFFAGLRGQALYKATLSGDHVQTITAHLQEQFGRLRSVTLGPDKQLYILTNNTDGRGTPKANDDKILRINPEAL